MSTFEQQIADAERELSGVRARLEWLQREQRNLKSRAFIEANQITADDVQLSAGDDVPYVGSSFAFGSWLKSVPLRKRFAEWNGQIHFRSDLEGGLFKPTAGLVEHLPNPQPAEP